MVHGRSNFIFFLLKVLHNSLKRSHELGKKVRKKVSYLFLCVKNPPEMMKWSAVAPISTFSGKSSPHFLEKMMSLEKSQVTFPFASKTNHAVALNSTFSCQKYTTIENVFFGVWRHFSRDDEYAPPPSHLCR